MQKKLMAVAVAGALATPAVAFAQASTVQIYGVIVQHVNYLDRNGPAAGSAATAPGSISHDIQNTTDSAFGVRGEEALGGGLSTWFQCETTFTLNDGVSTNTLCGKNSGVGFKGNNWGTAFVGVWDVPYKLAMTPLRPFSNTGTFGVGSPLWGQSAANVGNGVAGLNNAQSASSFVRRQKNLISYWSPSWSGFEFKAAFSNANEATAQTSATTASKPRMYSLGASYTNGPLYIAAGYEDHKNYNPTAATNYIGGHDKGWGLGAAYTFAGVFKLSGIYSKMSYDTNTPTPGGPTTPTFNSMDVKAWALFGDWAITGPHRLRLGYVHQQDTSGSLGFPSQGIAATVAQQAAARINVGNFVANGGLGDTGSTLYLIQYAYAMSKRTEVNFGYAKQNNDNNSVHALQSLGAGITGQDQSAWSVGIRHTF